jgi:hypothetical protein
VQLRALRRAPAAFAGDDLKARGSGSTAHDQRLDDALVADRGGEFLERVLGEAGGAAGRGWA